MAIEHLRYNGSTRTFAPVDEEPAKRCEEHMCILSPDGECPLCPE